METLTSPATYHMSFAQTDSQKKIVYKRNRDVAH